MSSSSLWSIGVSSIVYFIGMNKKALLIIAIVVIAGGAYLYNNQATPASAPSVATSTPQTAPKSSTSVVQKPAADQGAGGVYDSSAPSGTAAQCAACGQYTGAQEAQCLAALNC